MTAYDRWVLRGPEEYAYVGTEPGEECARWQEPDEDCPRSHQCNGTMAEADGEVRCDTCWEKAA